ncbi:MAG: hypothetical protein WBD90_06165 [Xanthobacteraceae bacterium]
MLLVVCSLLADKTKYYRDDIHGTRLRGLTANGPVNALSMLVQKPPALFTEEAERAFNANMDLVEAGKCLASGRYNATVYHLMQVAEIGLRALAWDRRVIVLRRKSLIPLEFAQWGEIIGELEKKKDLIDTWRRSKTLREEAKLFYNSAIYEISSLNDVCRKHNSHARGGLYEFDTALSWWGHVSRFMDTLASRMTESWRTPSVWKAGKKGVS